jgi:hypothetical protein
MVRVDESGADGLAVQVKQLGRVAPQRHHLIVVANREHAPVTQREGRRPRPLLVHRQDDAMMQDKVG